MSTDEISESADKLIGEGHKLLFLFMLDAKPEILTDEQLEVAKAAKEEGIPLQQAYQRWYTNAVPLIRTISPERIDEFIELYKTDHRRKGVSWRNYTIEDFILGMNHYGVDADSAFSSKFQSQLMILDSARASLASKLTDIRGTLQYELLDDELHAASELKKKGHHRAAGAVVGVVIERHLSEVCGNHEISFRKQNPTISDFNEALKNGSVIDVPMWRYVQRMGDIRNLCVHNKERDPKPDEVEDLIVGARKIVSEIA